MLFTHPSESAILAYLGDVPGLQTGQERADLDVHLDTCEDCHDLVVALAKTLSPDDEKIHTATGMPSVGELLGGRFRLQKVLGVGGMGVVFKAMDTVLGTPVAVKAFSPSRRIDTAALDSIRREANIGRKLQHPHIRRVFDLETAGDVTFLTMELIEGESLEDRLHRGPPFVEYEARSILKQLFDGVGAAHAAGVVHRDLKPGNIIIESGSGRVVVMDFGLARDADTAKHQTSLHKTGGLIGTPGYWSPEQSRGEAATSASDVFSLGLVAHQLLTGKPFSLTTPILVPSQYRRALDRCLAQRPEDRFPTAIAARDALLRDPRATRRVHAAIGFVCAATLLAAAFGVRLSSASESAAATASVRNEPTAAARLIESTPPAIVTAPIVHAQTGDIPTMTMPTAPPPPPRPKAPRGRAVVVVAPKGSATTVTTAETDPHAIDRNSPYALR